MSLLWFNLVAAQHYTAVCSLPPSQEDKGEIENKIELMGWDKNSLLRQRKEKEKEKEKQKKQ